MKIKIERILYKSHSSPTQQTNVWLSNPYFPWEESNERKKAGSSNGNQIISDLTWWEQGVPGLKREEWWMIEMHKAFMKCFIGNFKK